mmetsp:Transcript_75797/g.195305  ORF Transcript_75797/g.195305 Transcript_75797/m.195305 type:complete len:278 (-) Transcript_75797:2928-3761(-)
MAPRTLPGRTRGPRATARGRTPRCAGSTSASVLEQEAQVLLRQLCDRGRRAIDGAIEDELLLLLQGQDLLLHRALGDEAHGLDLPRLPDAMRPLDGLKLAGRVPPWVHQEHVVRDLQVQALSAGLQGDEDDLHARVRVEGDERVIPRLDGHAAAQHHARPPRALQAELHELQHGAELREDDGLGRRVALLHPVDLIDERLNLGAALEVGHVDLLQDVPLPHLRLFRGRGGTGSGGGLVGEREHRRRLLPDQAVPHGGGLLRRVEGVLPIRRRRGDRR